MDIFDHFEHSFAMWIFVGHRRYRSCFCVVGWLWIPWSASLPPSSCVVSWLAVWWHDEPQCVMFSVLEMRYSTAFNCFRNALTVWKYCSFFFCWSFAILPIWTLPHFKPMRCRLRRRVQFVVWFFSVFCSEICCHSASVSAPINKRLLWWFQLFNFIGSPRCHHCSLLNLYRCRLLLCCGEEASFVEWVNGTESLESTRWVAMSLLVCFACFCLVIVAIVFVFPTRNPCAPAIYH